MSPDPQIIRILLITLTETGVVRDREFEDCLIQGPAVLLPFGEGAVFSECNITAMDARPDAVFLEIPDGPRNGCVGLSNVTFRHCSFENIGIAGLPDDLARMREQIDRDA